LPHPVLIRVPESCTQNKPRRQSLQCSETSSLELSADGT